MMHFNPQERIALFIDGPNLYSAARSLGFDIDYKNLLDVFRQKGSLVRAFYYTALVEDQEYSPIRPLIDWLDYNGYTMVTKPAKEHTDASGRRKVKGNMDIELAIDMLEMAQHIDHAVRHAATRMPTTCRTSSKIRPRADQRRRTPKRVSTIATTCTKTPDHDQEHHRHR